MQPHETIWSNIKTISVGTFLLATTLLLAGCYPDEFETTPSVLRVGVLPDDEDAALRHKYAPLIGHLNNELGHEVELIIRWLHLFQCQSINKILIVSS